MCVTLSPPGQKITAPLPLPDLLAALQAYREGRIFTAKSESVRLAALRDLFSR
jgi:hypothetical protein